MQLELDQVTHAGDLVPRTAEQEIPKIANKLTQRMVQ